MSDAKGSVSTLLQEAAKVLEELESRYYWLSGPDNGEGPASVHDAELEREIFSGSPNECVAFINQKVAAALLRWLLTREPTEQMVRDGIACSGTVEDIYRAMNAALLKEMG